MYLHTVTEPKTPDAFISRLQEVEKIIIRSASADRLEHMRMNDFASDGPLSLEAMLEVQAKLNAAYKADGFKPSFSNEELAQAQSLPRSAASFKLHRGKP